MLVPRTSPRKRGDRSRWSRRGRAAKLPPMDGPDPFRAAVAAFPSAGRRLLIGYVAPESFAARLAPAQARQLADALGVEDDALLDALLPLAASYARAPISGFAVGAAALGRSGAVHLGANLEFAGTSPWASVHAEQAAIARAAQAGEAAIDAIAVTAAPCGLCRQFMAELGPPDALRVRAGGVATTLAALLPHGFGPADLGREGGLLAGPPAALALALASDDPLEHAALDAASASWAPYTGVRAGVALRLRSGALATGRYAESAAHNPSLAPLAAALSARVLDGREGDEIVGAVLVATGSALVDHAAPARALLTAVAPGVRLHLREAVAA